MRRVLVPVLAIAVGVVLSDSAIVTLALPDILRDLGASVAGVSWVLIAFNLVLALAAVPAARLCLRRDPAVLCVGGITIFAASSAACAVAPSMAFLVAGRSVQALGGALIIVSCLELLVVAAGSERRGVAYWASAGVVGTATGPVAGGVLTSAFSWQSIFIVQVPLALVAVPAALTMPSRVLVRRDPARDRPDGRANVALVLLSAALTAAIFLLVLLLVEGWRRSPAVAAMTVTVVPAAALAVGWAARAMRAGARAEVVAGCVLLAGGLAALAVLPAAKIGWTIAPQALVGLGLGLTVDSLTRTALRGRVPRALHGGWTIAARHAGVVLGLAVLTPVFTGDLRGAQGSAEEAIASLVLDAPLRASTKIDLAGGLGRQLNAERGRIPDLQPAFSALTIPAQEQVAANHLERDLDDQLERSATVAFRDAFLIAAAFALLALGYLLPRARDQPQ